MNKTKKSGTFTLLKIVFPVRGYQKESLKQSMMIGNEYHFAQNYPLFEYVFSVFDTDIFIRMQGREVWLFSMLYNKVGKNRNGLNVLVKVESS